MEVRTLSPSIEELPERSIGPRKQHALRSAIAHFLHEEPAYAHLPARIDVVAIRLTSPPEIQLFIDAFR
uniref:Uncharacterized protein n=1 Tax=uncultured Bacteroidota bacterium TaxID=152509 RepID=H5SMA2_9BACT|nr:hypothetical protein HGMM_F50B04C14 [uncultured Bacteroidetes bacterium]